MRVNVTKKKIILSMLVVVIIAGLLLYVFLPPSLHLIEIGGVTNWRIYSSEYYGVSDQVLSSLPEPEEEKKLFLWIPPAEACQSAELGLFVLKYASAELAKNAENQLIEAMKLLHGDEEKENTFSINGYDAFGIFDHPKAEAVTRKSEILYFVALDAGGHLWHVNVSMPAILNDLLENGIPQ